MSTHWGYHSHNGPEKWPELFPMASGHRQSPVNINRERTTRGSTLSSKLTWSYVPANTKSLVNPGYCWRVDVNGEGSRLSGGPLHTDVFQLEQFHCHWGCSDGKGSEHTVDGVSYSGELHLVHWNQTKYPTFNEAAKHPDGLAVLGAFLKIGKHHDELHKITKLLPFVMHKGDRVTLTEPCDPAKLLPENKAFWTYLGSLTTPPFSESVIWMVMKEPIEISHKQIELMRNLRCYDVNDECPCDEILGKVVNNYRPPLPLGNRELREYGHH